MTHAADFIRIEDVDGVRSIILNRPDKANALSAAMLDTLRSAVESAELSGVELIVLRSASPRLFCAGGDIDEFVSGPTSLHRQGSSLREAMGAMARCPIPVLAVARGKAAGAGAILLAMTDIVIAADDLEISCPEIAFNMYPVIVQIALETKMSPARARQLCLSGGVLDAVAAQNLGLVTDVFASDEFQQLADQRLAYYANRRAALKIARRARLLIELPSVMIKKIEVLEPLMHENFNYPNVRETILDYLATLKRK